MISMIRICATGLSVAMMATPALGHMQIIETPDMLIQRPGSVPLTFTFGHPEGMGAMLDMPLPEEVTLIHQVQRQYVVDDLVPAETNDAHRMYLTDVEIDGFGDYIVAIEGGLYHDSDEGGYVQQFSKAILNFGGVPSDWSDQIGMPVEIVPMVKPYAVPAGSTFTGRVVTPTGPVPYHQVDLVRLTDDEGEVVEPVWPGTLSVITDSEGIFTIGIPAAGHWLVAGFGAGPTRNLPNGESLTQDALLMIEAQPWFEQTAIQRDGQSSQRHSTRE